MIEYSADRRSAIYDGYKFRQDLKTGYYLSSKKTDIGKRERLHCYVWRKYNGVIPKGYQVHHKDHDKSNNDINNLELLTEAEHRKRHSDEMSDYEKAKRKEIIKNKALPKAVDWHKSQQGKEWHKKKYVNDAPKLHQKRTFVCLACGNEYIAEITGNNKFCSNKCKSNTGVKAGLIMKKEFVANAETFSEQINIQKSPVVKSVGIKKIEIIGKEQVYNMEVADNHNFAVNGGYIVHNCMDATRYFVHTKHIVRKGERGIL